jgi:DNA-binding NtrC family response regulator
VDLAKAKESGKFREDLFYRLNVITVQLPPLRERPEDIPLLAQHFLNLYAKKIGKNVTAIAPAALEALTGARWVGNVRELENCMERAVVLAAGATVEFEELPPDVRNNPKSGGELEVFSLAHLPYAQAKKLAMRAFERRYLSALLDRSNNNVSMAARAAGVDRSNFRRLLKQYEVGGRSMKPQGPANDDEAAGELDEAS